MRLLRPGLINSAKWVKIAYTLLMVFLLLLVWIAYSNHGSRIKAARYEIWRRQSVEEKFVILQDRLRFLEMQSLKKDNKIRSLEAKLRKAANSTHASVENEEKNAAFNEIMTLLRNKSGQFKFVPPVPEPEPLQASFTYTTMGHLQQNPRATSPAFQILSPRNSSDIEVVIGVPTVKRDKESYLTDTIKSLIDGLTPEEQAKTLIVICIGEADDLEYIADTAYNLNVMFEGHYGELIEVISPSRYWYPDWEALQPTLGDSQKRSQWRTKQNLDAVFLLSYAQNRGSYYLMLEDDVVARKGYMTEIMKFTANQTMYNPNWFFINYSTTGGIGKFFRMEELTFFSAYVQVLYQFMPIDWLIESYLAGRVCGINKTSKKCGELKDTIRPTYKTTLFEHAGLYSSLKGKIQKVKPVLRQGKETQLFFPHKNPPLESLTSTISAQAGHSIESLYQGLDFFWGYKPKKNDTIDFRFEEPIQLDKFFFRTGNSMNTKDIIKAGVVEVLPKKADAYVCVGQFDEFGNAEGSVDPRLWPILAIRIRILEIMARWIIISEVELLLENDMIQIEELSTKTSYISY